MKSWRVSAVSVQGTSHIKSALPCQDAFEWSCPTPGLLLAAVADGAGSARESLAGARAACRAALEFLERQSDPAQKIEESFCIARDAVMREADRLQVPPREVACTLILLVARENEVCAGQIGDGASLAEKLDGALDPVTRPGEAEYLNETTFLTGEDALEAVQVNHVRGDLQGVAMFSDGLQMLALKMPGATPHAPFFTPLFRFMRGEPDPQLRLDQLQKLLQSPRISQRADDDLTLLLATLV